MRLGLEHVYVGKGNEGHMKTNRGDPPSSSSSSSSSLPLPLLSQVLAVHPLLWRAVQLLLLSEDVETALPPHLTCAENGGDGEVSRV